MTEDREERTKTVGGNEVSLMSGMGVGLGEEGRTEKSSVRFKRGKAIRGIE